MGKNLAYQGKEENLKKGEPVGDFPGKFERSPLAPTPTLPKGENKNLSEKSLTTEKPPPKDQAPDPTLEKKSRQRGVYPVKREQISLFSLGEIPNPYPGRKRQISSQKHT